MHKQQALVAMLGIEGRALDARLIALLRALREHGSLAAAARSAGGSYRHAWGELGRITKALGAPIVELQRGPGSVLTPAVMSFLNLHHALEATLAASWHTPAKVLEQAQTPKTPVAAS